MFIPINQVIITCIAACRTRNCLHLCRRGVRDALLALCGSVLFMVLMAVCVGPAQIIVGGTQAT